MHYGLCTLFCLLDTKNRLRWGSSMGILSILLVQINGPKKPPLSISKKMCPLIKKLSRQIYSSILNNSENKKVLTNKC